LYMAPTNKLIILFLIICLIFSSEGADWNQTLNVGSFTPTSLPYPVSVSQITVFQSGPVTLNLDGMIPEGSDFSSFSVCLSYGFPPDSDVSTWSEQGCLLANIDNSFFQLGIKTDKTINIRDTTYINLYITLGLQAPTSNTTINDVEIQLSGTECDEDEINFEDECVFMQQLTPGTPIPISIVPSSWQFYFVYINQQNVVNTLQVETSGFEGGTGTYNPLRIYIRYGAAPTSNISDVMANPLTPTSEDIEAIYNQPGNGYYIIGVTNSNATNITTQISITITSCPNNTIGQNCSSPVVVISSTAYQGNQQLTPQSWSYYVVDTSTTSSFYIAAEQQNLTAPDAYARIINFPTLTFYDLVSKGKKVNVLNTQDANNLRVDTIVFPTKRNLIANTWYVGLYNPSSSAISYGTWSNTACPNNCSNQGTCEANVCTCNSGYTGVACENEPGGFKVEYIILIVVGGVIVLSIIIGIIVWGVKKRKRATYESF